MFKTLFSFLLLIMYLNLFSQIDKDKGDAMFLKNGDTINSQIVRVATNNIFYIDPVFDNITKIDKEKVLDWEFNNSTFYTNLDGKLEHSQVVELKGYSIDEIYRTIKDWFTINSSTYFDGYFFEDPANKIIIGQLSTDEYFKNDFISILSTLDGNRFTNREYRTSFTIKVRIKEERLKIYITDFFITNNQTEEKETLKYIYGRRRSRTGEVTESGEEVYRIVESLSKLINVISDHCKFVRIRDEYFDSEVNKLLLDDVW